MILGTLGARRRTTDALLEHLSHTKATVRCHVNGEMTTVWDRIDHEAAQAREAASRAREQHDRAADAVAETGRLVTLLERCLRRAAA